MVVIFKYFKMVACFYGVRENAVIKKKKSVSCAQIPNIRLAWALGWGHEIETVVRKRGAAGFVFQKACKAIMAAKPKLHYPNGRGRMESVRWVLAAAGVEVPCLVSSQICRTALRPLRKT